MLVASESSLLEASFKKPDDCTVEQDSSDEFEDLRGNLSAPEQHESPAAPSQGLFSWLQMPFPAESGDQTSSKQSQAESRRGSGPRSEEAGAHSRRQKVNHKDEYQQLRDRLEQTEARLKHAEGIEIGGVSVGSIPLVGGIVCATRRPEEIYKRDGEIDRLKARLADVEFEMRQKDARQATLAKSLEQGDHMSCVHVRVCVRTCVRACVHVCVVRVCLCV